MKKSTVCNSFLQLFLFVVILLVPSHLSAQKRYSHYEKYISTYHKMATEQMKKHKIPASITLAQGLLESGAGNGTLAKKANNHFGIKCHAGWKGGKIYKDDDLKHECFRKYKKVEDSFDDHSRFLADRPRYSRLFKYKMTDYRSWARGLQQCGYATDKAYANKLIKLIEDYELYKYDKGYKEPKHKKKDKKEEKVIVTPVFKHTPYKSKGMLYVVAQDGDTYKSIAKEFRFKEKDLCKFNEVPKEFPLKEGDIVYFQKKRSKAVEPNYQHVVKVGESMHSISQLYGLQLNNLYKMNKKDAEYVPVEGDVLKLR